MWWFKNERMWKYNNVVDLLSSIVHYSRQSSRDKLWLLWFNYLREKSLKRIGKTLTSRSTCCKLHILNRLLSYAFCTFGLMLRLGSASLTTSRSAQVQKYQKNKASQKWLKTGERFGRKKRRLLHFPSASDWCTKITCTSPAIIAGVSSLFFRCLFSIRHFWKAGPISINIQ